MSARITIKDVARRAGVSIGNASKVINQRGDVNQHLSDRVIKAISELNYHANGIARSLRRSSTHSLAVLLADITNPFQMMLARGIEEISYKHGYQLLISPTKENPEFERNNLKMFFEKRVDGIIVCTTGKVNKELRILRQYISIVLVDRPVFSLSMDIVADNDLLGIELLVEHLYRLGHRRIAVVHRDQNTIHGRIRHQGVMNAFEQYEISILPEYFVEGSFSYESGYQAIEQFFTQAKPPTAVLCANNNIAAGVLQACRDRSVEIPKDVSVVCYGDLEYSWNLTSPSITVVIQSPRAIGRQVAELILQRATSSEDFPNTHIFIKPELIVRESSSAPSGSG